MESDQDDRLLKRAVSLELMLVFGGAIVIVCWLLCTQRDPTIENMREELRTLNREQEKLREEVVIIKADLKYGR